MQKVVTEGKVALQLEVEYDGEPEDLAYDWVARTGDFDLSNPANLLTTPTSPSLVFAPNALIQGVEYVFDCKVSVNYSTSGQQQDGVQLLQGKVLRYLLLKSMSFTTRSLQ